MGRGMGRGHGMGRRIGRGMERGEGRSRISRGGGRLSNGYTLMTPGMSLSRGFLDGGTDSLGDESPGTDERLADPKGEVAELEREPPMSPLVAVVDAGRCIVCGICGRVCPVGAISVDRAVDIQRQNCTGCGCCVNECPRGALSLQERPF